MSASDAPGIENEEDYVDPVVFSDDIHIGRM